MMRLKDDFYQVKNMNQTATGVDYTIEMNPKHFIFKAHFPNQPITPGVCIIQIVKELVEEIVGRELFLKQVIQVKFQKVIDPNKHKEVTISISLSSISNDAHQIKAIVHADNLHFAKMSFSLTFF